MNLVRNLMRVVGAAIVAAVLALAPSAAKAHAGHGQHTPAGVELSHERDSVKASPTTNAHVAAASAMRHVEPANDDSNGRGCNGFCCSYMCVACSMILPWPSDAFVSPARSSEPFVLPDDGFWRNRVPDGLRRPPRSFA